MTVPLVAVPGMLETQRWQPGLEPYDGPRRFHLVEPPDDPIVLVTANLGGIDELHPLPPCEKVHGVCYTDASAATPGWENVDVVSEGTARRHARWLKYQLHTLVDGYRWLAWADACIRFKDLSFLYLWAEHLAALQPEQRIIFTPHPVRLTVQDEFSYIQQAVDAGLPYFVDRYGEGHMREQMRWMAEQGWPMSGRLVCTTVWMCERNERILPALDELWRQCEAFGLMDQLTPPPVLAHFGVRPQVFPVNTWENEYWSNHTHARNM